MTAWSPRKAPRALNRCPSYLGLWVLVLQLLNPLQASAADRDELPGLDGGRLTHDELGSGPVIVVVWASWSPRCRDIVQRANALARGWASRARVVTVVFQEEAEAVREFLSRQKREGRTLAVPVYLDSNGAFSKRHAVTTLPGLLIFNGGEVQYRGKLPSDPGPVLERSFG